MQSDLYVLFFLCAFARTHRPMCCALIAGIQREGLPFLSFHTELCIFMNEYLAYFRINRTSIRNKKTNKPRRKWEKHDLYIFFIGIAQKCCKVNESVVKCITQRVKVYANVAG